MLWVVDAHNTYQEGMRVPLLAQEGFSGLIVKATQGVSVYTAPAMFDTWIQQARSVNLVPGAYHWLTNVNGTRQADAYVRRIERHLADGLIMAVDNEDIANPASVATLEMFVNRVQSLTGRIPGFHYSGAWWAKSRIGSYNLSSLGMQIWDSKYVNGSGYASVLYQKVPASFWNPGYGGARTKMLQFSSHGTAGGIVGGVDVNAFDGTLTELQALAKGTDMSLDNDERSWLLNIWAGLFTGGDSCGDPVPSDDRLPASVSGNAVVDVLQYIRKRIDEGAHQQVLSDEQFMVLTDRVVGEVRQVMDAIQQAVGGAGDALGTLNDPKEES